MNQDALRTAVALYTAGTLDDDGAARYLGITPVGWVAYRESHDISPPATPALGGTDDPTSPTTT